MSFVPTRTTVALAAFTAFCVAVPAAGAKEHEPDAGTTAAPVIAPAADACGYVGTRVFEPWHDRHAYTLTPDGGFESAANGWTLGGGAAVAEGNETFQLAGAADHQSLSLPAGSSATSAPICVAKHDGLFRLFTRSEGAKARLKVRVVYANGRRGKTSVLRGQDAWAPSRKLAVAVGRAKQGTQTTGSITLRFTPLSGDWQIDDVYLDPRLRH